MEIMTLGIFTGFMVVLWGMGMKMLSNDIARAVMEINVKTPAIHLDGEIKQEIYDLMYQALDDTVGNMQLPTAKDNILSGIMQIVTAKMVGSMPGPVGNLIEEAIDSEAHGEAR